MINLGRSQIKNNNFQLSDPDMRLKINRASDKHIQIILNQECSTPRTFKASARFANLDQNSGKDKKMLRMNKNRKNSAGSCCSNTLSMAKTKFRNREEKKVYQSPAKITLFR